MVNTDTIKNQIIDTLKHIEQLKEAKRQQVKSYNEDIKELEANLETKLVELEEGERAQLDEEADEVLKDET